VRYARTSTIIELDSGSAPDFRRRPPPAAVDDPAVLHDPGFSRQKRDASNLAQVTCFLPPSGLSAEISRQ